MVIFNVTFNPKTCRLAEQLLKWVTRIKNILSSAIYRRLLINKHIISQIEILAVIVKYFLFFQWHCYRTAASCHTRRYLLRRKFRSVFTTIYFFFRLFFVVIFIYYYKQLNIDFELKWLVMFISSRSDTSGQFWYGSDPKWTICDFFISVSKRFSIPTSAFIPRRFILLYKYLFNFYINFLL